jgi:hypothetical protein
MKVVIAWDGDHIGREVGRASLADDVEGLRRVSQAIELGNRVWESWVTMNGGSVISMGGDEGRAEILAEKLGELPRVRDQYAGAVGSTVSVGVGTKLSEADRALMAGKLQGGNKIVLYTPEVDETIKKLQAQQGDRTEADKLSEEYLEKADQPGFKKPGAPSIQKPDTEASEHSQGEAAQATADQAPPPPEATASADQFEGQFHDAAQAQQAKDQGQPTTPGQDQLRTQVVQVLQQLKGQMPILEQIKGTAPDTYQAVMGLAQAVILMARQMNGDNPNQQGARETEDRAASQSQIEVPLPPEEQEGSKESSSKGDNSSSKDKESSSSDTKKSEGADAESVVIAENRKTKGREPHAFRAAIWTHPNGHPRCKLCGDEERTGGKCVGADHDGLAKAWPKDAAENEENQGADSVLRDMIVDGRPLAGQKQKPALRVGYKQVSNDQPAQEYPITPDPGLGGKLQRTNPKTGRALTAQPPLESALAEIRNGVQREKLGIGPGDKVGPNLNLDQEPILNESQSPGEGGPPRPAALLGQPSAPAAGQPYDVSSAAAMTNRARDFGLVRAPGGPKFLLGQTVRTAGGGLAKITGVKPVNRNGRQTYYYSWDDPENRRGGGGQDEDYFQEMTDAKKAELKPGKKDNWHSCDEHGHCWGDGQTADHCLLCGTTTEALEKDTLEANKAPALHHHLELPVGTHKDPGSQAARQDAGQIKIQHMDAGAPAKQGWIEARAGQVLSQDGHAISARNSGGK